MAANERRKEERITVSFPCELVFGRERASGTVLDLSSGGLSVASDAKADQGDSVFVRLHPKGHMTLLTPLFDRLELINDHVERNWEDEPTARISA